MHNISEIASACVGCFSCRNICPQKAIMTTLDEEGFLYPSISAEKCIECGLCLKVCPVSVEHDNKSNRIKAYYGKLSDNNIVKKSSSGGAFSIFAEKILIENGIIFGAIFDRKTKHIIYSDTDTCSIDELRKSKYVASETGNIFEKVKTELSKGRKVLFCGLPCHVDGLRLYLRKNNFIQNLILVDFICGGTASPAFFDKYLEHMENKYRSKVCNVDFRAKVYGWKEHSIKIEFEKGKVYKNYAMCDYFFKGYFEKTYQRDSCYSCQYRLKHFADLTIADYWMGLQRGINDNEGLSMIIINSEKGNDFFKDILAMKGHSFKEMPLEYSDYVFKTESDRYKKALKKKEEFLKSVQNHGFISTAKNFYLHHPLKDKVRTHISRYKSLIVERWQH